MRPKQLAAAPSGAAQQAGDERSPRRPRDGGLPGGHRGLDIGPVGGRHGRIAAHAIGPVGQHAAIGDGRGSLLEQPIGHDGQADEAAAELVAAQRGAGQLGAVRALVRARLRAKF